MKVEYNGIVLDVVNLISNADVPEYDETGKDYLWTRRRLDFEAIVSPQKVVGAYTPNNTVPQMGYVTADTSSFDPRYPNQERPNPLTPRQGENFTSSPPMTLIAIQQKLSQPRGKLKVSFHSDPNPNVSGDDDVEVWVEAPGNDIDGQPFPCDPCNGPHPIGSPSVSAMEGNARTFMVRMSIEWCENNCMPTLSQVPLISNQWTVRVAYDPETQLATRTYQGIAIFRADRLQKLGRFPDQFRFLLLPPVPARCQRFIDQLEQSPDGYSYLYTIRDVEQAIAYLDLPVDPYMVPTPGVYRRNAARISCVVDREYTQVGSAQVHETVLNNLQRMAWTSTSLIDAVNKSHALDDVAGAVGESVDDIPLIGGLGNLAKEGVRSLTSAMITGSVLGGTAISTANALLPTYTESVVCVVVMSGKGSKETGHKLAMSTAFGQLTVPGGIPAVQIALGQAAQFLPIQGAAQAAQYVLDIMQTVWSYYPVANTYKLTYDAFGKFVQFSVVQSYSGLLDWASGGIAGGWNAIIAPLKDEVYGGDWPASAFANTIVSTGVPTGTAVPVNQMPTLPDKGKLIGTAVQGAPGWDLPVTDQRQPPELTPPVKRLGTDFLGLVAQALTGECGFPDKKPVDRVPTDPGAPASSQVNVTGPGYGNDKTIPSS